MSDTVISVENLSKRYLIGHQSAERERYVALRDVIGREARNFIRKAGDLLRGRPIVQGDEVEEFWALKDVNFEVKSGEIVGIIGRNGAGKSTLLKILSRITEPTAGRVTLKGRVASLLEVGTGFHPELTGRENILLNGAILGMSRAEILRKFDEIVAFADIDEFLDTPVKRYSSGMYVRLAFAVAAHLEPEILVVDEVLAVGDAEFQKKCLSKMDESAKGGRTVLLVSHDMRKIAALCSRGILLSAGRVDRDGDISSVIDSYLARRMDSAAHVDLTRVPGRTGSGDAQFQSLELLKSGERSREFTLHDPLTLKIRVKVRKRVGTGLISIGISTSDGIPVLSFMNIDEQCHWVADSGEYEFTVTIDELLLYPGTYSIDLWLGDRNQSRLDYMREAASFIVSQSPKSTRELIKSDGLVVQRTSWECRKTMASAQAN